MMVLMVPLIGWVPTGWRESDSLTQVIDLQLGVSDTKRKYKQQRRDGNGGSDEETRDGSIRPWI
jgi:hypothetical protein